MIALAIAVGEFLPDACPLLHANHPEVPLLQLLRELFEATIGRHCQLFEKRQIKPEAESIEGIIFDAAACLAPLAAPPQKGQHLILFQLLKT